ncbi:MAG TPA: hypothetical protein VMU06_24140 [Stellaceae bacterium]|nr:hypothetical protein [Stellaceae bacterium]
MPRIACGLIAAALVLAGCNGRDPGAPSQQFQIDQDINASYGTNIPTSTNPGASGFGSAGSDPFGYSQVYGH